MREVLNDMKYAPSQMILFPFIIKHYPTIPFTLHSKPIASQTLATKNGERCDENESAVTRIDGITKNCRIFYM